MKTISSEEEKASHRKKALARYLAKRARRQLAKKVRSPFRYESRARTALGRERHKGRFVRTNTNEVPNVSSNTNIWTDVGLPILELLNQPLDFFKGNSVIDDPNFDLSLVKAEHPAAKCLLNKIMSFKCHHPFELSQMNAALHWALKRLEQNQIQLSSYGFYSPPLSTYIFSSSPTLFSSVPNLPELEELSPFVFKCFIEQFISWGIATYPASFNNIIFSDVLNEAFKDYIFSFAIKPSLNTERPRVGEAHSLFLKALLENDAHVMNFLWKNALTKIDINFQDNAGKSFFSYVIDGKLFDAGRFLLQLQDEILAQPNFPISIQGLIQLTALEGDLAVLSLLKKIDRWLGSECIEQENGRKVTVIEFLREANLTLSLAYLLESELMMTEELNFDVGLRF